MNDVAYMRDTVFFDGPEAGRRIGRFWILLVLSSLIAGAGVVADSTATVIGAMIVAPLMTPILGIMLAVILGDRANLARSIGLVLAAAGVAIAIGVVLGFLQPADVVAATNGQVAGRVNPRLIDLVAALATGVVASVALARSDISDTLPGVAIAISLVPPLAVVGLTLQAGEVDEAMGALLLFATNVAAILTTGIVVMWRYGVHRRAGEKAPDAQVRSRRAVGIVVAFLVVVAIPLTATSISIAGDQAREDAVRTAVDEWAAPFAWEVESVSTTVDGVVAKVVGPPPLPGTAGLAARLEAHGVDPSAVQVEFVARAPALGSAPDDPAAAHR